MYLLILLSFVAIIFMFILLISFVKMYLYLLLLVHVESLYKLRIGIFSISVFLALDFQRHSRRPQRGDWRIAMVVRILQYSKHAQAALRHYININLAGTLQYHYNIRQTTLSHLSVGVTSLSRYRPLSLFSTPYPPPPSML